VACLPKIESTDKNQKVELQSTIEKKYLEFHSVTITVTTLEFGDCEYVNCLLGDLRIASSSLSLLIEVPDFSVSLTASLLIFLSFLFLDLLVHPALEFQRHSKSAFALRKFSG
jgi:hypothetical protein